jgi:hypothetical protein
MPPPPPPPAILDELAFLREQLARLPTRAEVRWIVLRGDAWRVGRDRGRRAAAGTVTSGGGGGDM